MSARDGVEDGPVALGAREGQPSGELLPAERAADRGFRLNEPQAAEVELDVGAWREGRLAGGDVDRAGGGVLAEERPLRSAQHLDPIDVEEVEGRRGRPRVEDAVDVQPDAGLDPVVGEPERRAKPADVDRRVARVGRIELDRGDQFLQPVHVERSGVGDKIAAHDRDRDRHLLRNLFDASRRHDDVLAETRRRQRHVDFRRLARLQHQAPHGRLEPGE